MICKRISIASDLSEAALEEASRSLFGDSPRVLFVSSNLIDVAEKLKRKGGFNELRVDTNLPPEAWYLTNEYFGIFSPGA